MNGSNPSTDTEDRLGGRFSAFSIRYDSGRLNRASAIETKDLGLIPGRAKPKTRKIGNPRIKKVVWSLHHVW